MSGRKLLDRITLHADGTHGLPCVFFFSLKFPSVCAVYSSFVSVNFLAMQICTSIVF